MPNVSELLFLPQGLHPWGIIKKQQQHRHVRSVCSLIYKAATSKGKLVTIVLWKEFMVFCFLRLFLSAAIVYGTEPTTDLTLETQVHLKDGQMIKMDEYWKGNNVSHEGEIPSIISDYSIYCIIVYNLINHTVSMDSPVKIFKSIIPANIWDRKSKKVRKYKKNLNISGHEKHLSMSDLKVWTVCPLHCFPFLL